VAAQRRFDEIFPARAADWNVDLTGLGQLGSERMQSGDMEGFEAVMTMVMNLSEAMMQETQRELGIPDPPPEPEPDSREARPREQSFRERMGEPRDDLARFVGQYGEPEAEEPRRNLFAAVRCDGYLVVGATWGDASNWHMRSVGEAAFETRSFDDTLVRFEFEVGPEGTPVALRHNLDFMDSPLSFVGELPEGWGTECIPPPGG
jgi:hypothetical protein